VNCHINSSGHVWRNKKASRRCLKTDSDGAEVMSKSNYSFHTLSAKTARKRPLANCVKSER